MKTIREPLCDTENSLVWTVIKRESDFINPDNDQDVAIDLLITFVRLGGRVQSVECGHYDHWSLDDLKAFARKQEQTELDWYDEIRAATGV